MELNGRNQSLAEVRATNRRQSWTILGLTAGLLLIAGKAFTQSEIVIQQVPGLPEKAVIEKGTMDKGSQRAVLIAVTSAIVQVNPANAEYQKAFIQSFLAPIAYTRVSHEIDAQVARLVDQRELGSYYFVFREYQYDAKVDKHFVLGEVHTVNAAKDTAQPYVFEFSVQMENYRLWVQDVRSYLGDRIREPGKAT